MRGIDACALYVEHLIGEWKDEAKRAAVGHELRGFKFGLLAAGIKHDDVAAILGAFADATGERPW